MNVNLNLENIQTANYEELDNLAHLICGTKQNYFDSGVPEYPEIDFSNNPITVRVNECFKDVADDLATKGIIVNYNKEIVRILDPKFKELFFIYNKDKTFDGNNFYKDTVIRFVNPEECYVYYANDQIRYVNLEDFKVPSNRWYYSGFVKCINLEYFKFPKALTELGSNGTQTTFSGCKNLKKIDFNELTYVTNQTISGLSGLETVIIRRGLRNTVNISSSPIKNFICEDINNFYNYYADSCTASFSYSGKTNLYLLNDLENPIKSIIIPEDIIKIRAGQFTNFNNITVQLHDNITSIDAGAFCLYNNPIEFPEKLTTLGAFAFSQSKCLPNNLTIPDGVTSIPSSCFERTNLNIVNLNNVTTLNKGQNPGTLYQGGAFESSTVKEVICPKLTNVGQGSFYRCSNLKIIDLSNAVSLESYALRNCPELETITLADNLQTIAEHCFTSDTKLTLKDNKLPDSLINLKTGCFGACSNLIISKIPNNITTLDGYVFCKTAIENIDLNNVAIIKAGAFAECYNLTSVTGENVLAINDNSTSAIYANANKGAFESCGNLISVNIPNNSYISNRTFANCSSLSTLNMAPPTSIGQSAFNGCKKLTQVDISQATLIDDYAFLGCGISNADLSSCNYLHMGAFKQSNLKEIDLNTITSMENPANEVNGEFYNCNFLEKVYNLRCSCNGLFEACYNLGEVSIMEGCSTLQNNSFKYDYNLSLIDLPDTVVALQSTSALPPNKCKFLVSSEEIKQKYLKTTYWNTIAADRFITEKPTYTIYDYISNENSVGQCYLSDFDYWSIGVNNWDYEIEFEPLANTTSKSYIMIIGRTENYSIFLNSGSQINGRHAGGSIYSSLVPLNKYSTIKIGQTTIINGEEIGKTTNTTNTNGGFELFGYNNNILNVPVRIKYFKAWSDTKTAGQDPILRMHWVPAMRNDGTVGMLNLIGNRFISNAGSGDFIVGNELIYSMHTPFTPVTQDQVIDTGIKTSTGNFKGLIVVAADFEGYNSKNTPITLLSDQYNSNPWPGWALQGLLHTDYLYFYTPNANNQHLISNEFNKIAIRINETNIKYTTNGTDWVDLGNFKPNDVSTLLIGGAIQDGNYIQTYKHLISSVDIYDESEGQIDANSFFK